MEAAEATVKALLRDMQRKSMASADQRFARQLCSNAVNCLARSMGAFHRAQDRYVVCLPFARRRAPVDWRP
jgi:hypothetical protein